jgi:hypothetical protein
MSAVPIAEVVSRINGQSADGPPLGAVAMEPIPPREMRRVWAIMAQIFGHGWLTNYGDSADSPAGETWSRGLAGLSRAQIAEGIRAVGTSGAEWPPSMPRFRAMCLGVPSYAAVAEEIRLTSSEPSTAFARLVWWRLDSFHYRLADAKQADRMLRDSYDLACQHVLKGGSLPPAPVKVISSVEPEYRRADPAVVQTAISASLQILNGTSVPTNSAETILGPADCMIPAASDATSEGTMRGYAQPDIS